MASQTNGQEMYDLVTIGAGSGGTRASRMIAKNGLKVAVIELPFGLVSSDKVGGAGGTCVIRGCVPKKLFWYASHYHSDFSDSRGFGWKETHPGFDMDTLLSKKLSEVKRLSGIYTNLMKNSGCDCIDGYGKILDKNSVEVTRPDGTVTVLKTKNILVCTGGRAFVPDIPGKEHCVTSDEALAFEKVPETLCIIGGGYIAVEMAGIYAGLGSKVHIVYRKALPLRGFDEECRTMVATSLENHGITVHANCSPTAISKDNDMLSITMNGPEGVKVISANQCLFATGRRPNVNNIGLENVGVELGPSKAIKVNNILQTNVPNIWALGDVIDRVQLTPVAISEAMALTQTMNGNPTEPDYVNIPSAVFCQPPLATVGLSEEQAIETLTGEIDVYTSNFRALKHTLSGSKERSLTKLIVDVQTDKVVGAHMVGPDAAEIMQGIGIAIKCGATKAQFDSTIAIHPSSAEEFVIMRTPTRRVTCRGTVSKI